MPNTSLISLKQSWLPHHFQHFLRLHTGSIARLIASNHPGNFLHSFRIAEHMGGNHRAAVLLNVVNHKQIRSSSRPKSLIG